MKGKLKIIIPVVLVAMGAGYKLALAKPTPPPKPHVEGTVYVLGKEFLVNLADGRFAKLTAALVLSHKDTSTGGAEGHAATVKPPEGFGPMEQEGIVRSIITDTLTGAKDAQLEDAVKRAKLRKDILARIERQTDVKAEDIVFTDLTVQ